MDIHRRILIIDDNVADVMLIRALLGEGEFAHATVETAMTLEAGLRAARRTCPDIVLLDLGLPDSRGLATVERMLDFSSPFALVVLTGLDDSEVAIEAVKLGAEDYWHKGELTGSMVARGIRYAIERHRVGRDLRDAQRQLLHAQKMDAIGRLAGGVAHDFNNLLMAIMGCAELLAESSLAEDEAGLVADVLAAGRSGAELTRQLLCLSRRQAGELETVDLARLVKTTSRMIQRMVTADVQVTVSVQPGDYLARVVPSQIEQVLLNLAINARDAMEHHGRLSIALQNVRRRIGDADVDAICLTVEDDGCGMDEETCDQIFEPFFTTKAAGHGTGLGLATAYAVVKQAGGEIEVDSVVGDGTRFAVVLPRAAEQADASARPTESTGRVPVEAGTVEQLPTGCRSPATRSILVVDDVEGVRNFMVRALRDSGFKVQHASSGVEAIALMRATMTPIDLLLSDVVMPGINGYETAAAALELQPDMVVVFVSGLAAAPPTAGPLARLRAPILAKPISAEELVRAVHAALVKAGQPANSEVA